MPINPALIFRYFTEASDEPPWILLRKN